MAAAKRPRPAPAPAPSSSFQSYDDDIQEVVPVKSEPGTAAAAPATHYEEAPGQEHQVALEEQYDESYDYGQYGEAGYDDGSGMIDPNTGMPIQAADGNKDLASSMMSSFMSDGGVMWRCNECHYVSKNKFNVLEHIDAKHIVSQGITCSICYKICSN